MSLVIKTIFQTLHVILTIVLLSWAIFSGVWLYKVSKQSKKGEFIFNILTLDKNQNSTYNYY